MIDDRIPELNIEYMDDGIGEGLILLEQDNSGNVERVAIHPIHLRHIAEKCGLIESTDFEAQKTIATLKRRLLALRDRIDHLQDWLANRSDHQHADLSYEVTYATATIDLADEWCIDMGLTSPATGLVPNRDTIAADQ